MYIQIVFLFKSHNHKRNTFYLFQIKAQYNISLFVLILHSCCQSRAITIFQLYFVAIVLLWLLLLMIFWCYDAWNLSICIEISKNAAIYISLTPLLYFCHQFNFAFNSTFHILYILIFLDKDKVQYIRWITYITLLLWITI